MTDFKKNKAVIVGADHPTGLGMARALAKGGCHLTGYYRNDTPCCKSTYWDQLIQVDNYNEIVEKLVELGKLRKHKSALFVSADNLVKIISDNRDILRKYYSFLLPEKNVIDCFLDKTSFHEWAIQNGMKVPESYICSSYEELDSCLGRISFPVIIKPFEKTEKWDQLSPAYKTIQLHCKSEIDTIPFDLFVAASKILVQQWIPGGDRNVYFCLVCYNGNGQKVADFTGRKLFQWPVLCGSTAAAIGEENEEVGRMTEEIFNLVRYQGLGSVEFKRSDADGKFYIIEPTVGRNDLQSNVAFAGGVNLAAIALAEVLGTKPPDIKRKKAAWIHEEGLLDSLRVCSKMQCLRKADLLKLLRPSIAFAHFSFIDPSPAFDLIRKKVRKK